MNESVRTVWRVYTCQIEDNHVGARGILGGVYTNE